MSSATSRKARSAGRLVRTAGGRRALAHRASGVPVLGRLAAWYLEASASSPADRYVAMQRAAYEGAGLSDAEGVSPGDLQSDFVVGSWREHDEWPDYGDYLMRHVPADGGWVALDFACGPGRNIRRWSSHFARIDGADIAQANLDNARRFLAALPAPKQPRLFLTGGADCGGAPTASYDFVFSTIALQHICVHSIRYRILEDMFRVLRPGGRVSIQMGFGSDSPDTVPYAADYVDAPGTNRACDTAVASPDEPRADLERIGFTEFESWVRPVGPGDRHPQWIFFTAVKPGL